MMFRFLGKGLMKKIFERFSMSHRVAQGYFSGNYKTGTQLAIRCQSQAIAILTKMLAKRGDKSNCAKCA
jgi:hypothetical protein